MGTPNEGTNLNPGQPDSEQIRSHPADLADALERLAPEEADQSFRKLPADERAAVLAELDRETWPAFLEHQSVPEIVSVVSELPHEDAVDLLGVLPTEKRTQVLSQIPPDERQQINRLLTYPPDTAGGIMTDEYICLRQDLTVEQAQALLRSRPEEAPRSVAYLYVVDDASRLVGIIPIHDLVFRAPHRKISDLMSREVKHVWVDDDQEQIARLFEHYHYMALPVLERDRKLVGLVLAHQAMNVLQSEATEDMQLMVGLSGEERVLTPWHQSIRRRLPWLCINLGTAFLAAAVVGAFEETIAAWTALAIFLPIVAGQGGNAGMQTLTVI
ncbi:MAG: magnesium transporter, partial [Verrucomicrobiota bacterium]|nr:magnesium transporter [Verrucomicrobiota bacterium]